VVERRREVEALIRDRTRRVAGVRGGTVSVAAAIDVAVDALGDRALLEYAHLDGRLYAVSVVRGRARLHELGDASVVQAEIDAIEFSLNRLHRSHGSARSRESARQLLGEAGARLDDLLLPADVVRGDRPLLIVPTGRLHGLAWRALPRLGRRTMTVAPSLVGWCAGRQAPPARRVTALVAGPGLPGASAEVAALASLHRRPRVLDVSRSTAERCVDVLEQAGLVHFSCHGSFRRDNPLFSALHVSDGDLTVYDMERCRRLPHTIVVSACNAAQTSVLRGGALLGMTSALLQLGVATVVAPLTPVSDDESVDVMVRFHRRLVAGASAAEALAEASFEGGALDPVAATFVCLGG
jgi:hypothetical protein